MSRSLYASVLSFSFCLAICAEEAVETAKQPLPITRVVLYKNGVGYFEHAGQIHGDGQVAVPFTSGQLNDVLKSLTVLDLSGGRISGISYDTAAPVERQLGDLRLPSADSASLTDFLRGLRGARVEVHSGATTIGGRLLSVERKTRTGGGTTLEVDYVSLIGDNGEVRTTELSPGYSLRLLDRGLPGKIDRYLDILASVREPDVRSLVISGEGSGDRSLFVGYISEVPVWKATYRIVLGSKAAPHPLLQGWAIVDNTIGEDWDKVQLSLVAGAPQSFIQNLSQPYYAHRPVVPLPDTYSSTPQTFEATLIPGRGSLSGVVTDATGAVVPDSTVKLFDAAGNLAGQTATNGSGRYAFGALAGGPFRLEAQAAGFATTTITGITASLANPMKQDVTLQVGATAEAVSVTAAAPGVQTDAGMVARGGNAGSGRALGRGVGLGRGSVGGVPGGVAGGAVGGILSIETARAQARAAATARGLGDLFEYKLKEPITIRKNSSALVPIIQAPIDAEKVSIWNEAAGMARPERALWLTNSSGLTLDEGTFSVLDDEAFAGEGVFDSIAPGEKRLVSYATDLALTANSRNSAEQESVTRVLVSHGVLEQDRAVRESRTYTVRNEDTQARTVVIEHPVRAGYKLTSDTQPAETTADWMRFRLEVPAKQTAALTVAEEKPEQTTVALTNLTGDQVALWVRQRSINSTVQQGLERILKQKAAVDALEAQKDARDQEKQQIFDDQQRLRENMKSLKGSPEEKALLQRYTKELDDEETRLKTIDSEIQKLSDQHDATDAELDRMIGELSMDVKL